MSAYQDCFAFVLSEEGGYSDNPADPGGATNRGITLATLSKWRGHDCTKQDVFNLPVAEAGAIYAAEYWNVVRGDDLPPGVNLSVFDFGVNAGNPRSARMLQAAAGLPVEDQDGHIGPVSLAAVRKGSAFQIIGALADAQEAHYRSLPTFAKFGKGWMARTDRRRAAATSMATAAAAPKSAPLGAPALAPAPSPPPERPSGLAAFLAAVIGLFRRKGA